jgi:hypothetical protein
MTFCFHRIIVFVSVLALSCGVAHRASAQCPGDCYDDGLGVVNGGDLAMVLGNWGVSGSSSADLTEDGLVDGRDLSIVLGAWGPCSPVLSAVSPLGGSPTGGMLITLSGKYLFGATEVMVGGTPATNVRVVNDSTVTAVAPAGPLGATSVLVTTPRGSASLLDAFTYVTVPAWATLLEATPDPAVVWDADLRAAITATGLAWRVKDSATQIEMVLIPSGQFSMGCSPAAPYGCGNDEYPIHSVGISVARYLGRFEVTQSQWQLVMRKTQVSFRTRVSRYRSRRCSAAPWSR